LVVGACDNRSTTSPEPSPSPDLEVRDAAEALDTALVYLREHENQNAPSVSIEWQEVDITPSGIVGNVTKEFTSDEWTVTVSYPVVAPADTIYQVEVSNPEIGWHWAGTVRSDGSVTEISPVTPSPDLVVTNATQTQSIVLDYLRAHVSQKAPSADIVWQEEDVTPKDEYGHPVPGAVHKEFTSDEWTVKVSYAVLPPEMTVYRVVVSSIKLGWHWKGSVKADGGVTEESAFKQMSEEESQKIAEEFLRNSPTFVFDGMEDTLMLADTLTARCPYCWAFIFEFDCAHPGYADRTGKVLAQVITPHRAVIGVEELEITSAVIDERWDMVRREWVGIRETLTVAELVDNPVYDTLVRIHGEVSLFGELLCPCFKLTSGGQTVQVWYDLMVENDGTERPPANMQEFNNGDSVIVTGELKAEGGAHYSKGDFWAIDIVVVDLSPVIVPPQEVPMGVSVEVSCDDFVSTRHISKETDVAASDLFTVTLCSNPTTGFQWESAELSDQSVLEQIAHKFEAPETTLVGAGGKEVWTFRALEPGTSTISMEYSRPWEGGEKAEWTFVLTVTVE